MQEKNLYKRLWKIELAWDLFYYYFYRYTSFKCIALLSLNLDTMNWNKLGDGMLHKWFSLFWGLLELDIQCEMEKEVN